MTKSPQPQRILGQTKDAGFQIGLRQSFAVTPQQAWAIITSQSGIDLWLEAGATLPVEKGARYATPTGVQGEMRVYNRPSHLRLTWQPPSWKFPSTVQIRVIPNGAKTVISFHQEKLAGPEEREAMRLRWQTVLAQLANLMEIR